MLFSLSVSTVIWFELFKEKICRDKNELIHFTTIFQFGFETKKIHAVHNKSKMFTDVTRPQRYKSLFFCSFGSPFFLLSGMALCAFFRRNFLIDLALRSPSKRIGVCLLLPGKK